MGKIKTYLFLAYKTELDYPSEPYMFKVFKDFDKMKIFSGNHSYKEKKKFPEYTCTYYNFTTNHFIAEKEILKLRQAIYSADPTGHEIVIKDLAKQCDSIIKKLEM